MSFTTKIRRLKSGANLALASLFFITQSASAVAAQASDAEAAHVRLRIPGYEPRGLLVLPDATIHAELVNQRANAVEVQLVVDVQAHGVLRAQDLGTFRLDPRAARRIDISVSGLGIAPDQLETPAILTPRLTILDEAGAAIEGRVDEAHYMHQDKRRGLILYKERHLLRRFRGGDLGGRFKDERGADAFPKQIKIFAGFANGEVDTWATPPVYSAGLKTICVHWSYLSHDHRAGERYYQNGESMAARGVKISVFQQGHPAQTQYASTATGCASFSLDTGLAYASVEAEARLGVHGNIHVRAFESSNDKNKGLVRKWAYYFFAGDEPAHLHVPAGLSSSMMALGGFAAHRLDQMDPLFDPEAPDEIYALDLEYTKNEKNSDANKSWVKVADPQRYFKFMYGHEVGHWYSMLRHFDFRDTYGYPGISAPCWSNDVEEYRHLLRSAETNLAAMNEGWAHFLSTLIWNGQGWETPRFRYYKIVDEAHYEDLGDADNIVDMAAAIGNPSPLGGQRNWRDTMCTQDPTHKFSVELDWARFFTNYLEGDLWSNLPTAAPSFAELVALMQHADANGLQADPDNENYHYKAYPYLHSALLDPGLGQLGFVARWQLLAEEYGVAATWP